LVVTGRGGTLATAFERICACRGLECVALPRNVLDIAESASIADTLDRYRPWAVINAAGYVRVDAAETDEERCRRENTRGPTALANACATRGLRLLAFSSDLVFDGLAARRYVESDLVNPVNAYGRSKAEADTAVLTEFPDALIARTSAFFGPWDGANAVHQALAAVSEGRRWCCACDQRVSPTYVPDLVNVALDLLIDGAAGVWHLANDGDVSWSELARMACILAGHADDLIVDCASASLQQPAVRPSYSVLGTERGQRLPPLADALRRFVADRASGAALPIARDGGDASRHRVPPRSDTAA
jgi:dTDP-4-dehydrorhamnose reductase